MRRFVPIALLAGLAGASLLLPGMAGAQASIPFYVTPAAAVDYPVNSSTNPDYSLQGTLGEDFVTVDLPTNTGQTLAYAGFQQTAVRYRYVGNVTLQGWIPSPAIIPLQVRFYNNGGVLRNTEVNVPQDSNGNYFADSWINPNFIGTMTIKGVGANLTPALASWLGKNVAVAAPANFLAYPTAANALLLGGDANNDNINDSDDFGILASTFFLSSSDAGFDARADFNGDGIVDSDDFGILAANFFLTGDE